MFPSTLIALLSISAVLVAAAHDTRAANHKRAAHALVKRSSKSSGKRCKVKAPAADIVHTSSHTTTKAAPTPTHTSTTASHSVSSGGNNGNGGGSSAGTMKVVSSSCGAAKGSTEVSATNGPNGELLWLNCGVNAGGWNPPMVKASDLITKDLSTALQDPKSPFTACAAYIDLFVKYAAINDLPSILVASISMQESSCNAATVGGAGEQGLMQLTKDKCGPAPGGNCKDPEFNISVGVKYFADTLASFNGNIIYTMGTYNGWTTGMTVGSAIAMKSQCCRCQPNLDYLHQIFNGWLQNVDPYETVMGLYFNLNVCGLY